MKQGTHTIHANKGGVLDCACVVDVVCDGETIAFEFPQITHKDKMGPTVYACMDGTDLTLRLCDRDDVEWGFAWCEAAGRWLLRDSPNAANEPCSEAE